MIMMSRVARVTCAVGIAVHAGVALAHPVLARDEPRPIQVAHDPVPPDPSQATIALATASMAYVSDTDDALRRFGPGGELGIVHVPHRSGPGFEVSARFTQGE